LPLDVARVGDVVHDGASDLSSEGGIDGFIWGLEKLFEDGREGLALEVGENFLGTDGEFGGFRVDRGLVAGVV